MGSVGRAEAAAGRGGRSGTLAGLLATPSGGSDRPRAGVRRCGFKTRATKNIGRERAAAVSGIWSRWGAFVMAHGEMRGLPLLKDL